MRRRQLRARDYARCQGCGRLSERDSLRRGPDGLLLGPECLPRAVAAYARVTDVNRSGIVGEGSPGTPVPPSE